MAAPVDNFKSNLVCALPLNSEWGYHDATSYIKDVPSTKFSMSPNGGVIISSSQYKYYSSSAYFDGAGDSLISSETVNLPGDFTLECWVRWSGSSNIENSDQHFFAVRDGSSNGISLFRENIGGKFAVWLGSLSTQITSSTTTLLANTWYHVAVTRQGTTVKMFVNGNQEYSATHSFDIGSRKVSVGSRWSNDFGFNGFIQDARIYRGAAKYTSNFTSPTQIVDFYSDTSGKNFEILSLPFNSSFKCSDASNKIKMHGIANSNAVTGVTISTAQSKFYGQSALFNGSGNHINVKSLSGAIGFQDFTIEAWVYHTGSADDTIFSDSGSFTFVYGASGKLRFYTGAGSNLVDATPNFISNAWTHVAAVRKNGTLTFYQNGTAVGSHPYTVSISNFSTDAYIGKYYGGTTQDWAGYMQDLRIYNGYGKYSANFTPSTIGIAPSTSISTTGRPFQKIDTIEITNTGLIRPCFSGISQDFTNLIIKATLKSSGTSSVGSLATRFNGDYSTSYTAYVKYGEGSGYGTFAAANQNYGHFGYVSTNNAQNNIYNYGALEGIIFGYAAGGPKNYLVDAHFQSDSPTSATTYQAAVQGIVSGGWYSPASLTSLEVIEFGSNPFVEGSIITLYGIV
jgi:hypothetical protein